MTKAELEARRDECCLEFDKNLDYCPVCHGFDAAVELLQGEMDAEKERYELALASSIRYGNKVFDLESQLQSANAKLAELEKDKARLDLVIRNYNSPALTRETLDAALEAGSE